MLVIINISALYYTHKKTSEILKMKTISPLLNPMRMFVSDKDAIVNLQSLRNYLKDTYETNSSVSIYFEFLNTGANISINQNGEFFPASLLKVPIAMAAVKNIEEGKWNWETGLELTESDKDNHFGFLYEQPAGTIFTVQYLIEQMLENSDNTAYYTLLRNLEKNPPTQSVWNHLGLQEFFTTDGKISAKRYAVVLRSLYNAAYLSKDNSAKIIMLLSQTPFTEYLEQGLPQEVEFAHKIGEIPNQSIYMDAGIVYLPNRPYVLIVMTQGKEKKEAENIMKDISLRAYQYINGYDGNDE
jgi:beta-lactamase class A